MTPVAVDSSSHVQEITTICSPARRLPDKVAKTLTTDLPPCPLSNRRPRARRRTLLHFRPKRINRHPLDRHGVLMGVQQHDRPSPRTVQTGDHIVPAGRHFNPAGAGPPGVQSTGRGNRLLAFPDTRAPKRYAPSGGRWESQRALAEWDVDPRPHLSHFWEKRQRKLSVISLRL